MSREAFIDPRIRKLGLPSDVVRDWHMYENGGMATLHVRFDSGLVVYRPKGQPSHFDLCNTDAIDKRYARK